MGELIRELFEQHQAKLLNLDYEQLKQQFDRHEECFNKRYATFSCFEKEFDVWEACWSARQSEIDQLKAEKAELEKDLLRIKTKYSSTKAMEMGSSKRLSVIEALIESWREKHMGGSSDYARGSLHSRQDCIDELDKALRGDS